MEKFLKRWGVKKDNLYYFIVFNTFKRNNGETIPEFNNRFCKLYHCIPGEVNPSEPTVMVIYVAAFEAEFALHLSERKSTNLKAMFNDVEDLESNMRASGIQLKTRYDPPERREYPDRRRGKEP